MKRPKVVVLCGPTGVGKTAVAVAVAKAFSAEIVNADSMQVYRYMDIGTAKPSVEERRAVKHYLIDILDPDQPFSAASYAAAARTVIDALHQKGILSLVVGGTGLYIKALLHGLFKEDPKTPGIRARLKAEAARIGSETLHARLQRLDPESARRIHPNDTVRVIRAMEICESTQTPLSTLHSAHGFSQKPYDVLKIGLTLERSVLYERINRRVDQMLAAGLLGEVKSLLELGYDPALKSMQSIGYRHMVQFIQKERSWEEAVALIKRDTRRYAKRQWTWFKADPQVTWHAPDAMDAIHLAVAGHLEG
ncbi:MAG: tRNA (adenosine(37)-N6)-dimethylallyltransferase MiaA [Deltaproteobacteria bacterium]|nr:tRNA (adenosine(37)-N6)-dimethylallyltransferase MiaA [Deltaproteobacteria bacterium]